MEKQKRKKTTRKKMKKKEYSHRFRKCVVLDGMKDHLVNQTDKLAQTLLGNPKIHKNDAQIYPKFK